MKTTDILFDSFKKQVQRPSQSIQTLTVWNGRFISVAAGVQLTNSFAITTPSRAIKIVDIFAWANKIIPTAIPLDTKLTFSIVAGSSSTPYSAPNGFTPAAPSVLVDPVSNPVSYSFPLGSSPLKTIGFILSPGGVYNFQVIAQGNFAIADQTDTYAEIHYYTL